MDLMALILYGVVNLAMVLSHLVVPGHFYRFPFWVGMISLGWFYPQAIGGYSLQDVYPPNAYADGLFFASLCTVAVWIGFNVAVGKVSHRPSWLDAEFDYTKLYYSGLALCVFGFYFQWKLFSLPEEVLAESQWSGTAVKYLFFANVFKIGFIVLWLSYLRQPRLLVTKYLLLIIPCLLLFLEAIVIRGRRAGMMDLVAYLFVGIWFVRKKTIPRWFLITGMVFGLVLINGIRTYRLIMKDKDRPLAERLSDAANADYMESSKKRLESSGAEFNNYIFYRQIYAVSKVYDLGVVHWNRFVFNYVPAQIVGREFKDSLELTPTSEDIRELVKEEFGHTFKTGTTVTGYKDAFGSFGWFGFIKFMLIGYMMGALYKRAMVGALLAQILYIYCLTKGMQIVSHGTNDILIRVWVYFFTLGYPLLYWAKVRHKEPEPYSVVN